MMWDGTLSPRLAKHRDGLHDSVWSHLRAHGATWRAVQNVSVSINPITEEPYDEPREYFEVEITMPDGTIYVYLIESEGLTVSEQDVERAMQEYSKHKVKGGRYISDYVDVSADEVIGPDRTKQYAGKFSIDDIL